MLHPNAKDRILNHCPESFDVEWDHPVLGPIQRTFTPEIRWTDRQDPPSYPVIAMSITPDGVPRFVNYAKHPGRTHYEPHPNDPEIAYTRYDGRPMRGQLQITVAANSSVDSIPPHTVVRLIAFDVFHAYEFDSTYLMIEGDRDYEWPVKIEQPTGEGIVNTSGYRDEQYVQSRAMAFDIEYNHWSKTEVAQLDKIEYEFGIDHSYDGEVDDEDYVGPFTVDVGPDTEDDE